MSGAALLFPGQGSQYVGMGADLAADAASVRELYELADDTIEVPLSRLSWDGPEDELRATENAQPAILLHSWAVWTLIGGDVGAVEVGAGHSLGELSAYLVAGAFGFEDALRLVRRRGELMATAGAERPGTMAAVLGLGQDELEGICDAVTGQGSGAVVPANLNAPGQIVISGDTDAVAAAGALATEAGARRVMPLNVSGAFHSPLMAGAGESLEMALAATDLADPSFPVVSNATAESVSDADTARRTLVSQVTAPVRWAEGVARMRESDPSRWIEVGPGKVLSGLVRRIDREIRVTAVGDSASVDALVGATE